MRKLHHWPLRNAALRLSRLALRNGASPAAALYQFRIAAQ
jgi:hypothetical protein